MLRSPVVASLAGWLAILEFPELATPDSSMQPTTTLARLARSLQRHRLLKEAPLSFISQRTVCITPSGVLLPNVHQTRPQPHIAPNTVLFMLYQVYMRALLTLCLLLEYSQAVSSDPEFPDQVYMAAVEKRFRDAGIVVPSILNDAYPHGYFVPGSGEGAVDIYGHDGYPL